MKKDLCEQVRYLRDVKKLSFRQIALQLSIARKTAAKAYQRGSKNTESSFILLSPVMQELLVRWFQEQPRLKASQVWQRLQDRGFKIGLRTVARYTREFRKKKPSVHFHLDFLPGEEGQVDWFFEHHPLLGKVCGFVMILSYSRFAFLYFFPRHSFEFFIDAHLKAFSNFRGVPRNLRYDNLKSVVLSREPLTYNPAFLSFARHHQVEIRLCNVARGNEKGRVERLIRHIRDTLLNTTQNCASLNALNLAASEWMNARNHRDHRVTRKTPVSLFADEHLKPLPLETWINEVPLPLKLMSKTGTVTVDSNHYSVPDYLSGESLTVYLSPFSLRICNSKGREVAKHPRSFETGKVFINPAHRSFKKISEEAKRERIHGVIMNLDPLVEDFLKISRTNGEDPYTNAYLLFRLLSEHARETIFSAIRQSLTEKKPSIQEVYRLLKQIPGQDPVHPKNSTLLNLNFQPRSLEAYGNEK